MQAHYTRHSLKTIAANTDVSHGFVKLRAPAIALIALTCACKNIPTQIESHSLADLSTHSSERFIVAGVDNDPVDFVARAGSTPGRYGLIATYESTSRARHIMHSIEQDYGLHESSAWLIEPLHMHCAVLLIPEGADRESLLVRLSRDPRIKLAQPLQTFTTRSKRSNDLDVSSAHEMALDPH
jgi:hypothetical protein